MSNEARLAPWASPDTEKLLQGQSLFEGPATAGSDERNPYQAASGDWYWYDVFEKGHGPYPTEVLAEQSFASYLLGHDHAVLVK